MQLGGINLDYHVRLSKRDYEIILELQRSIKSDKGPHSFAHVFDHVGTLVYVELTFDELDHEMALAHTFLTLRQDYVIDFQVPTSL